MTSNHLLFADLSTGGIVKQAKLFVEIEKVQTRKYQVCAVLRNYPLIEENSKGELEMRESSLSFDELMGSC